MYLHSDDTMRNTKKAKKHHLGNTGSNTDSNTYLQVQPVDIESTLAEAVVGDGIRVEHLYVKHAVVDALVQEGEHLVEDLEQYQYHW